MQTTHSSESRKNLIFSWIVVVSTAVLFLVWGFFLYFMVGDKGPPIWGYGVVEDIPGQSPYSTYRLKQPPTVYTSPGGEDVIGQHITGHGNEWEVTRRNESQ